MDKIVVSGSISYLNKQYKSLFRSEKWAVTKVKHWSDGKYTYVFEYVGND